VSVGLPLGVGLARQGQVEHLLGQDGAELEEEVLHVGEACAVRRAVGPVELIHEVFGDAFEVRADFIDLGRVLLDACHPWFLSVVASTKPTDCFRSL
jgi:hypothetical protein